MKRLIYRHQGFTLIEIMIVVAIIALLAAVAVPGFLRARKRSQASAVLELYRVFDGAKEQYSIEYPHPSSIYPRPIDLFSYLKPGTKAYADYAAGVDTTDVLGNKVYISRADVPPQVATETIKEFDEVLGNSASFWGPYDLDGATRY